MNRDPTLQRMIACPPRRRFGRWLVAALAPLLVALGAHGQAGSPLEPPPQDAIEAAVRRGVEYLLAQQQRDGSWAHESQRYPTGQTALSAYALIKAGLPQEHPALRRALAFLEQDLPEETYSMGCQLMLLEATHDAAWKTRMERIVARLESIALEGEWGYPLTHSDPTWIPREGRPDLSNTQYAVLGLRAAHHGGIELPRKLWGDLVDRVLAYQEGPRTVESAAFKSRKVIGHLEVAGFRYVNDGSAGPSGSMTAAGLTVLGIAREILGDKLGVRRVRAIEDASQRGLDWLALNWSVETNPGSGGWHKYYLYGLERVGGVLRIEEIGGHAWFAEGARLLLTTQRGDGSWDDNEPDTCFAILFLRRATAAVASNVSAAMAPARFASPEDGELVLRGLGEPNIALWIDPPARALRARFPEGLHVERVEYLVDGEVVARVEGDPGRAWENERFAARHQFTTRGTHRVSARAHLLPATGVAAPPFLEAGPFDVVVRYALEEWMLEHAARRSRNLLSGLPLTVSASSQISDGEGPAKVCDGKEGTRWLAQRGDDRPWIRLELGRPVKADRIVLTQATSREYYREYLSRVARAELVLNRDSEPLLVTFEADEMRPTVVELDAPRALTQIELRVLERTSGNAWPDLLGLAEIVLELAR